MYFTPRRHGFTSFPSTPPDPSPETVVVIRAAPVRLAAELGPAFAIPHDDGDIRPPMVNLSRSMTEQILVDAIERTENRTLRWHCRVTGCRRGDDRVTVDMATPVGTKRLRTRWLIAGDSARAGHSAASAPTRAVRRPGRAHDGGSDDPDERRSRDTPTPEPATGREAGDHRVRANGDRVDEERNESWPTIARSVKCRRRGTRNTANPTAGCTTRN